MMLARTIAALVLSMALVGAAAADDYGGLRVYTVDGNIADVKQDVQDAIINRGYRIDHRGFIGNMLKRTGEAVGSSEVLYKDAEYYVFCSASLSRRMMQADRRNIGFCPYVIAVYEPADSPGKVHVGYRRPALVGSEASRKVLAEIDKLLDDIAREATE